MTRWLAVSGALFALGAVVLGAFGAHALADQVSPERSEVWRTAAHYLGWHGTGLLALAALCPSGQPASAAQRLMGIAGWLLIGGTLVFSVSLFALVLTGIGALGAITPIGGLLMTLGWAIAALGLLRR
jgi:uncharacterized membrane protein YgdD (TMEM256/DUF423 family)